jgi:hypothetical protein
MVGRPMQRRGSYVPESARSGVFRVMRRAG